MQSTQLRCLAASGILSLPSPSSLLTVEIIPATTDNGRSSLHTNIIIITPQKQNSTPCFQSSTTLVMEPPYLAVAIYHPRYGNFQHWALHLHSDTEDLIFEVDGEHPCFQKAVSNGLPSDNLGFIESLFVCQIGSPDIPTVKDVVDATPVDNETLEWDCQDYVLDILEGCEREAVLEDEDADYAEAMEILRSRRGPIL